MLQDKISMEDWEMYAVLKGPLVMAGLTPSAGSLAMEENGAQDSSLQGLPSAGVCHTGASCLTSHALKF